MSNDYVCKEHEEMKLPAGKTCDNCVHIKRCLAFGFTELGRTSCDFHPNKFREIKESF